MFRPITFYIEQRYTAPRYSGGGTGQMARKQRTAIRPESQLPLAPATFQILLALAGGERHGYAIMKEVAARNDGAVRLGPGTLYGALKRLLETGLVEEGG